MKHIRPQNEMLTKMEQTLNQRKAERRKLEAELRIGQEDGISQQRLSELSANRVTQFLLTICLHAAN